MRIFVVLLALALATKMPEGSAQPQLAALLLNAQKLSLHLLKDKLQGKEKDAEVKPIIQGTDFVTFRPSL